VEHEDQSQSGRPAIASDLVDVPKLITAYYEDRPDPHVAEQRVVFGTSGHRGSSFDRSFNEDHILAGEWLRLELRLPGSKIWLRCWEVSVGRTKLYLLDTNDFSNSAAHRGITSELYGGDAEDYVENGRMHLPYPHPGNKSKQQRAMSRNSPR
jgi:glucan phosphorylase